MSRSAAPRTSAAEAPAAPCLCGWPPAAVGIVLLPAGPDGERPQRGTGLPQRELREGRDPGRQLGCLSEGFPSCLLCCGHIGEAFECLPVCSAGLLILSSFAEAAGDYRRLRVSQAAGGRRRLLWIPVQVFPGHSYQS